MPCAASSAVTLLPCHFGFSYEPRALPWNALLPDFITATCATPGKAISALLPLVLNCASSSANEFR